MSRQSSIDGSLADRTASKTAEEPRLDFGPRIRFTLREDVPKMLWSAATPRPCLKEGMMNRLIADPRHVIQVWVERHSPHWQAAQRHMTELRRDGSVMRIHFARSRRSQRAAYSVPVQRSPHDDATISFDGEIFILLQNLWPCISWQWPFFVTKTANRRHESAGCRGRAPQ